MRSSTCAGHRRIVAVEPHIAVQNSALVHLNTLAACNALSALKAHYSHIEWMTLPLL